MTKYGIKRACIAIAVLFAVNIAVITLAQRADAASIQAWLYRQCRFPKFSRSSRTGATPSADVGGVVQAAARRRRCCSSSRKTVSPPTARPRTETLAALGISSAGLIEQNTSGDVALLGAAHLLPRRAARATRDRSPWARS